MLIAHVHFEVAPDAADEVLRALQKTVPPVASMPGCLSFRPFADPAKPGDILILHEWASEQNFGAYLASPQFAALGQAIRPHLSAPPRSRRFHAQLIEEAA